MPEDAVLVLDHILLEQGEFRLTADWQVAKGQRVALIGPSGAGKSSLLAVISGFYAPASGRVMWERQDLAGMRPGARPLSLLFQDQNLFPHLTVAQNLGLGLRPDLRLSPAEERQIEEALECVGLGGLGGRRPAALSGGQASRAALARVLLRARPLLLLDEPFSALGPAMKRDMLALVSDVVTETGATLLMVTHDPVDALGFCDHTVLVAGGVAEAPVPTEALFADPPPGLRAYLGG